jgi:hypothetical protein
VDAPINFVVPSSLPAVCIGLRPFAAQFHTAAFISEELGKLLLFIIRAVRAIIMNVCSIEEFGSPVGVKLRNSEHQNVCNGSNNPIRMGWATRDIDHRSFDFIKLEELIHSH